MRNRVERFDVNIKPLPKRFDVKLSRRRFDWGRKLACAVAAIPAVLAASLLYDAGGPAPADAYLDRIVPAFGVSQPTDGTILLHRAGDGAFYADIVLGERIVNARIAPEQGRSTIAAGYLAPTVAEGAYVELSELIIEGRTLNEVRLAVGEKTVIGRDLLKRLGPVEDGEAELRIAGR